MTIRPWRDGDEVGLIRLFLRTFGRPISTDHWKWKLRAGAPAFENVWLALSRDQPIFQYAGIPIRFSLDRTEVPAVVSVDTMTAPEFRRRGLLTQVAGKAYGAWRDAQVAFVIGLPNENWGSRARALGWQSLFPLQWLVRPLRPEAMLAGRLAWPALERLGFIGSLWNAALGTRLRPAQDIEVEDVAEATSEFDRIWECCRSELTFSTVRDERWIRWRFLSSPARNYVVSLARHRGQPTGYVCHTVVQAGGRKSGFVADLLCRRTDDDTRSSLLASLLARLRETNVESVRALAIPGTAEFSWLRRAGFLPSHAFRVEIVPLRPDLPLDRMRDPTQWHLTGADFDVV